MFKILRDWIYCMQDDETPITYPVPRTNFSTTETTQNIARYGNIYRLIDNFYPVPKIPM